MLTDILRLEIQDLRCVDIALLFKVVFNARGIHLGNTSSMNLDMAVLTMIDSWRYGAVYFQGFSLPFS